MYDSNQPVRRAGHAAALIAALASFFGALAVAPQLLTLQDWSAPIAVALGVLGTGILGTEVGRAKAWGPETVDDLLSAEAVVAAAERGEHG